MAVGRDEATEQGGITLFTILYTMEENSVEETAVESRTEKDKSNSSGKYVVL